jgi:sporulation protein YlmC with PRC-barrel domain
MMARLSLGIGYRFQQLNFWMLYLRTRGGIQDMLNIFMHEQRIDPQEDKEMAHWGTLKDTRISEAAEDIRGATLYGTNDEKLGKIEDVIFDHSTGLIRYVVVDTGGWLKTTEFIVPADRLRASANHKDEFDVDLNKQQIESFPPYNEGDLESEDRWGKYERGYRSKWETNPVMHRAETDRNITPTTQQMPGNSPSARAAGAAQGWAAGTVTESDADTAGVEAAAAPTERAVPAGTDSVVIGVSAVGISGRWDTFQSRLRERRKQAVAGCKTCSGESAAKRGSESTDTLRKAV